MPSARRRKIKKLVVKPLNDAGMTLDTSLNSPYVYEAVLANAQTNFVIGLSPSYAQSFVLAMTGNVQTYPFKVTNAENARFPHYSGTLAPDISKQTVFKNSDGKIVDLKWEAGANKLGFGDTTPLNFFAAGMPWIYAGTQGFSWNFGHYYMGGTTYTASSPSPVALGGLCIMSPNQPSAPYVAGINNGQANAPSHAGTTTSGGRPVHRLHIPATVTGSSATNFEGPWYTKTSLNLNFVGRPGDGEQIQIWCSGSTGNPLTRDGYGKLTGTISVETGRLYSSTPNYQGGTWSCDESMNFDIPTGALPINIVWTGSAMGTMPDGPSTAVTTGWQIFVKPTGSCADSIQQ